MVGKVHIVKGDITRVETDAIVNAANSSLMGGGGVDGAIHYAGGPAILEECKQIILQQGPLKTGEAVITTGGDLPAKFVIHTVGPVWAGGNRKEIQLLENCYTNSLKLAGENNCTSIAFPNISTGAYQFPKQLAASVAISSTCNFLQKNDRLSLVYFICYDAENFVFMSNALEEFILME